MQSNGDTGNLHFGKKLVGCLQIECCMNSLESLGTTAQPQSSGRILYEPRFVKPVSYVFDSY